MNLLSGYLSEVDPVWLFFAGLMLLVVLYYIIQWMRSNRNYRDSADDHAKSCLESVGWGCMIPLTVVMLVATVLIT